jgi:tape measure domain-containing protein
MNVENNVRYTLDLNDLMSNKLSSLILLTERLNTSVDKAKISYRSLANIAVAANETMMVSSRKVSVAVMNMNEAFKSTASSGSTRQLAKNIKDVANDSKEAVKNAEKLNTALKNTNKTTKETKSVFKDLISYSALMYAKDKIVQFGSGVMETTRKVEEIQNQLNFASGSVRQGGADYEYARQKANELGLDLITTAKAFARMQGAAMGTSYAGEGVRKIFEGVSMASTVLHLSADETEGTMYALQQMMSKGKVSAEELNRQLGNRLPGALGIASRAMGLTAGKFMELMKEGKILSEDFLPKFADQLKKEFAGGVASARESITVQTNLMNNALIDFQYNLGETTKGLQLGVIKGLTAFYEKLSEGSRYLKEHDSVARGLGVGLGILAAGFGLATIGILGLTTGVWGLVAALWATGIPEIIIMISALAGTLVYAYNEFEGFHKIIDASVPSIIAIGKAIWASLIMPIKSIAHLLAGAVALLTGNFDKAGQIFKGLIDTFTAPWRALKEGIIEADKTYRESSLSNVSKTKHFNTFSYFNEGVEPYNPNIESLSDYMKRIKNSKEKGVKGAKGEEIETKAGKSTTGVGKGYGHNIYININKLIETQNIKVENAAKDFANNIAEEVSKALLMAVNDANRIATQ